MAFVIVHTFTGATKEQYEAMATVVLPPNGGLPKGMLAQVAGPSAQGWTIVATLESKAAWERFRDDVLTPAFKNGVKGGFNGPPSHELAFEVAHTLK